MNSRSDFDCLCPHFEPSDWAVFVYLRAFIATVEFYVLRGTSVPCIFVLIVGLLWGQIDSQKSCHRFLRVPTHSTALWPDARPILFSTAKSLPDGWSFWREHLAFLHSSPTLKSLWPRHAFVHFSLEIEVKSPKLDSWHRSDAIYEKSYYGENLGRKCHFWSDRWTGERQS